MSIAPDDQELTVNGEVFAVNYDPATSATDPAPADASSRPSGMLCRLPG